MTKPEKSQLLWELEIHLKPEVYQYQHQYNSSFIINVMATIHKIWVISLTKFEDLISAFVSFTLVYHQFVHVLRWTIHEGQWEKVAFWDSSNWAQLPWTRDTSVQTNGDILVFECQQASSGKVDLVPCGCKYICYSTVPNCHWTAGCLAMHHVSWWWRTCAYSPPVTNGRSWSSYTQAYFEHTWGRAQCMCHHIWWHQCHCCYAILHAHLSTAWLNRAVGESWCGRYHMICSPSYLVSVP